MPAQSRPRFTVHLKDPQALRDAMEFSDLDIRELSERCGSMRHRSTIGHLHSGARSTCSPHLAASIEKVLRLPRHSLFMADISNAHMGTTANGRRAA